MTPENLEAACRELFGESWKGSLAVALGRDPSTRYRQSKRGEVPGPVQAAVIAWLVLRRGFGVLPPEAPEAPFHSVLTGRPLPLEDEGVPDIAAAARKLFGEKWKLPTADALGIDRTSLWRLMSSDHPSGPVVAALRAWLLVYRFAGVVPPFDLSTFPAPAKVPDELSYRRRPDGTRRKKAKSKYAVLVEGETDSEGDMPAEVREVGE